MQLNTKIISTRHNRPPSVVMANLTAVVCLFAALHRIQFNLLFEKSKIMKSTSNTIKLRAVTHASELNNQGCKNSDACLCSLVFVSVDLKIVH